MPQKGDPIAMGEPSIHTHEVLIFNPPIQKWEDMPGIGECMSKISILRKEGVIEKISYERRAYESVDHMSHS